MMYSPADQSIEEFYKRQEVLLPHTSPADQSIEEFYKHQEVLLPHTSPYLGKTNVDIGCGTGLTSIIHQQQIGISPTICDVADFRHPLARSLPFHLNPR